MSVPYMVIVGTVYKCGSQLMSGADLLSSNAERPESVISRNQPSAGGDGDGEVWASSWSGTATPAGELIHRMML